MLPVTRANLDKICCICLVDIQESVFKQTVYDVKEEKNLSKLLKLTAHITVLKNPLNLKYINDYCRKVCEICFLKTQFSFHFREKILASTVALKELLENGSISEGEDMEKLQHFCRICLNRQKDTGNNNGEMYNKYLKLIKDCCGIRFSGLQEATTFRIKEGTNINELVVIRDEQFPKQLCRMCLKKLLNVDEFRSLATHSFEYMISVMGDESDVQEDLLAKQDIHLLKKGILWEKRPPIQKISIQENTSKCQRAFYDNNIVKSNQIVTNPNPVEEIMLNFETECTQMQETIIWNNQHQGNLDSTKHSISEIRGKPKDSQYQVNDFIVSLLSTTDASTADLDKNTIDNNDDVNSVGNDDERDHDFVATDTEESSLTDYDDVIEDIKKCPPKQSNQKNKIKSKSTRKIKKNLKAEKNKQKLNEEKEIFKCKVCLKILSSKKGLKRHERTVHSTSLEKHEPTEAEKLTNTCHICSKYFKQKHHLREHIRAVHEKQKPFKCSYCPNTFTSNNSRRVHELIHSGEFPFVCKWCQKGFRRSHLLKIHVERHTAIPELLCPICKRSQSTKEELTNHLKMHDEKRSQCPSCGKLFKSITHLKDHQNAVHLKLRPFKCEFCNMAFGDRKTRRVHEKSHTEERPIACIVCGRGFKLHSSFKRHLKYCNSGINPNDINKVNHMDTALKI